MDKQKFIDEWGPLFDSTCHYSGSGYRQYSENEKANFLILLWEKLVKDSEESPLPAYKSDVFILALMYVQKKYRSTQEQADHLEYWVRFYQAQQEANAKNSIGKVVP